VKTAARPELVRMPRSAPSLLRADLRRLGVRRASRAWGLSPRDALAVAAGLAVDPSVVRAVLEHVLSLVPR